MVFNKAAQGERRLTEKSIQKEEMTQVGWCETMVPVWLLEELGIPYETGNPYRVSRYAPGKVIYVPVWVYVVWFNAEKRTDWAKMKPLLAAMRDDPSEQELACSELSLNLDVPRSTREAARNYVDRLHQRTLDEPSRTHR